MIATRAELIKVLIQYHSPYPEEIEFRERFLKLLAETRCFFRDHLPGHITGSALILDPTGSFVLLTHHAKLNRWLQPGGHADGDENIANVALREAAEETGLKSLKLLGRSFFDIDIHVIPATSAFPAHDHYDVRFLFQASKDEPLTITAESHDLDWKKITDIHEISENDPSMIRMMDKGVTWLRSSTARMQ